ncbi:MAG TPA: hypothetical protein VMI12_07445 [Puia sp.]|nr:hypothetical protein [Puia sp.]
MEPTAYIDSYFNGELAADEKQQFENKIIEDPSFAEEVANYLSAFQIAKEQSEEIKKQHFLEIYKQSKTHKTSGMMRKLWPSIAIAAMLAGIILGIYLFIQPVSAQQLADGYIRDHFQNLGVNMGKRDSMEAAKEEYNADKPIAALKSFERIILSDSSNFEAKEYAGIVCLRLQQYDRAMLYFKQLEADTTAYINPSLFYQALTLMKRNHSGDVREAKQLLQKVVKNDLEGKEIAEEWLKKL